MDDSMVMVERRGAVATVTLNRPEKLNVINTPMISELTRAFADLDADDGPKVIILQGAGRAFAAGADVREMRELDASSGRDFITRLHGLFSTIAAIDALVIAVVRGPALGAGCELVAVCDLRIAGRSAAFGMPEIRVGLPSVIEAAVLVPLIGLGRTQHLVYTGDMIDAEEACAAGLVHRVVADADLAAEAAALAGRIAGYSRVALRLQKSLVRKWYYTEAFDRAVKLGIDHLSQAFAVPDPRDAMDAFLGKRDIRFDALGR